MARVEDVTPPDEAELESIESCLLGARLDLLRVERMLGINTLIGSARRRHFVALPTHQPDLLALWRDLKEEERTLAAELASLTRWDLPSAP